MSYKRYASTMARVVITLVRIKMLEDEMSKTVLRRDNREDEAIRTLVQYILQTPTNPEPHPNYDSKLDVLLFKTLEALFYRKINPTHIDGSPICSLMMLMWFRDNGSHQPASRITHLCAVIQYWVRSTVVHSIRLAARGHKNYVPFEARGTDHNDTMISEENDEGVVSEYVNRLPFPLSDDNLHLLQGSG